MAVTLGMGAQASSLGPHLGRGTTDLALGPIWRGRTQALLLGPHLGV